MKRKGKHDFDARIEELELTAPFLAANAEARGILDED